MQYANTLPAKFFRDQLGQHLGRDGIGGLCTANCDTRTDLDATFTDEAQMYLAHDRSERAHTRQQIKARGQQINAQYGYDSESDRLCDEAEYEHCGIWSILAIADRKDATSEDAGPTIA